jgi:predicted esterase
VTNATKRLFGFLALFGACSEPKAARPITAPYEAVSSAPATPVTERGGRFAELSIEGFLPAYVYVPAGDGPWQLVVATHGAGGAPEWECEYWRRLTAGRMFIACLRGTPIDQRTSGSYYYKDHRALGREFAALNAALDAQFGPRLAPGFAVYAGFSQGAIMGAPMIVPFAGRYRRLALIEGGYEYWSVATARAFAKNGGERVLFACGTRFCAQKAEQPAAWLRKFKVDVRIEYAEGAGHTPAREVKTKVERALPWLLGD